MLKIILVLTMIMILKMGKINRYLFRIIIKMSVYRRGSRLRNKKYLWVPIRVLGLRRKREKMAVSVRKLDA